MSEPVLGKEYLVIQAMRGKGDLKQVVKQLRQHDDAKSKHGHKPLS